FIEYLALAIYLTSGSPLRGEEVVLITYKNTIETGLRDLTIEPRLGLIRLNSRWHKMQNTTNIGSKSTRYFGPKLSNILKLYLLVVLPFYNFLSIKALGITTISPYLLEYNNSIIKSSSISNLLVKETKNFFKVGINISNYR
ncbi:hypothetical protein BU16DRAFT_427321, partial [Lophium mytilinum]